MTGVQTCALPIWVTTGGQEGSASGNSLHAGATLSDSSSLANAFGTSRRLQSHSRDQTILAGDVALKASAVYGRLPFANRMGPFKKEESSSPSLSSPASSFSADLEAEAEADAEGGRSNLGNLEVSSPLVGNASRPSFKRLPSQTLGPDNQKRPFYGFGEEGLEDRAIGGWGVAGDELIEVSAGLGGGESITERKMRKRRMSEPSTSGSFEREE